MAVLILAGRARASGELSLQANEIFSKVGVTLHGVESGGGHFPARFFAPPDPQFQLKTPTLLPVTSFACFAVSPVAQAADGGLDSFKTAEDTMLTFHARARGRRGRAATWKWRKTLVQQCKIYDHFVVHFFATRRPNAITP